MFKFKLLLLTFAAALQLSAVSLAPAPLQNYVPIVLVNNTGQPSSQVYFVLYGLDANDVPCFLTPNLTTGICTYSYVSPTGLPSSASSSVTLSQLPTAINTGLTGQAYLVYVPLNISSRGYFSVNSPVYLLTSFDSAIGSINIAAVSPGAYTDPNFYTLNGFVEFVFEPVSNQTSATQLYLDLSYVDYFSIPLQLAAYSYPSNTVIQAPTLPSNDILSTPSGMAATTGITRDTILTTSLSGLTGVWNALGIPFYANQYTDTTPLTYLKILAAKNSIALSEGTGFQMPATPLTYFPSDYVYTASIPSTPTAISLMQYAWNSLNATIFYSQVYPQSEAPTIYAISAYSTAPGPTNLTIQFVDQTNHPPQSVLLDLATLGTENLLSGATWPFYPPSGQALPSVAYTNELSKLISALFGIGQFPPTGIATSITNPFSNSTTPDTGTTVAFTSLSYFSNPRGTGSTGPWYNLFDQVMHPQMVSTDSVATNPTMGQGYAYDYDDLLGMSGTISGMFVQDANGNPAATTSFNGSTYQTCSPYFVISLGNLGDQIPNISNDAYAYAVTVGAANSGVSVVFNYYDQHGVLQHTTAPAAGTTVLNPTPSGDGLIHVNSTQPFSATFTFSYGSGPTTITRTYLINLQRQIALPSTTTSTYDAIDAQFLTGITFTVAGTATAPTFTINVDSTVPPWPG